MDGRLPNDHAPAGRKPKCGVRLLQCNNELCQYEMRPGGDIVWAEHENNSVKHTWDDQPKAVLIIKKPNDARLTAALKVPLLLTLRPDPL